MTQDELMVVADDLAALARRQPGHDDGGMGLGNWEMHLAATVLMNSGMMFPVEVSGKGARMVHTVAWWRPGIPAAMGRN